MKNCYEAIASSPYLSTQVSDAPRLPTMPAGTAVADNRYVIDGILGRGGYSVVYRACDRCTKRHVALKISQVQYSRSTVAARILEHERRVFERVGQHPNIVQVYGIHYVPWQGYLLRVLAMDLIDGGTLREWLVALRERHDLRVRMGLGLMIHACRGLIAMHAAGAVHLDLKPENCLISRDGRLMLSDFGAARVFCGTEITDHVSHSLSLYHLTPTYASPDQWMAAPYGRVTPASDVYSLGVVMFEVFSPACQPPFEGSIDELQHDHVHTEAPPLRSGDPRLDAIVRRCLAKSVSCRTSVQSLAHESEALFSLRSERHSRKHVTRVLYPR